MKPKLVIIGLMLLLMVTMVNALEFDNVYNYDDVTKTATFVNGFGLGDEIGKARLETPQNLDLAPGYQKVAEFKLWAYDDYNEAIKSLDFYNKKAGDDWKNNKINRQFDIKFFDGYENITVNVYGCVEEEVYYDEIFQSNITNCLQTEVVGTELKRVEKWTKLTPTDLKDGDIVSVGIFTEVIEGDSVEWIPTIYGLEIEEWASWTSNLNTDLVAYWNLDEGTGNALDSLGTHDLTETGTVPNQTGIIESARGVYSTSNYFRKDGVNTVNKNQALSVNSWIKRTGAVSGADYVVVLGSEVSGDYGFYLRFLATDKINFDISKAGSTTHLSLQSTNDLILNEWTHVVATVNSTGYGKLYINGSLDQEGQTTDNTFTNADQVNLGVLYYAGAPSGELSVGHIDEVGYWDRELTSAEVTQLWNNGAGISYGVSNPPTVVLNTPANDTTLNTNSISQDFTCKGIDDIKLDNLTFYLWNVSTGALITTDTNTDGQNDTLETFTYTITGGTNYTWNCLAFDNSSASAFATNNYTINVISTPDEAPNVTLNSPANDTTYLTSPQSITFNCSAFDGINLVNVSLIIDGSVNLTNSSGVNNTDYLFTPSAFNDGSYTWSCRGTDNQSQQTQPTARTFTVDGNAPVVNITAPANGTIITQFNQSINLEWTAIDPNIDSCWYVFDDNHFETCYQESANTSDQTGEDGNCNQVYNGTYSFTGSPTNPANAYDGSFSTFSTLSGDTYYVNYTKPPNAVFGTKVRNRITDGATLNLTVPLNCWNNYPDRIEFRMLQTAGKVFFDCKADAEPSGWQSLRFRNGDTIYEEAVIWNISLQNFVNCGDNTTVINYPTTNPSTVKVTFFANDTVSNEANDNVTVVKSTVAPQINITSPVDNYDKVLNNTGLDLNVTVTNTTVLDTCLYEYNGANNSITCSNSISENLTYIDGVNTVNVCINDTLGNANCTTQSWIVKVLETGVEFDNPVFEGSTQQFIFNITTDSSVAVAEAHLIYGTTVNDTSTLRVSGNNYQLVNSIEIPDVLAEENKTFYWEIVLSDSTWVNTSTNNQTVQPINIDDCSAYSVVLYNLTMYDEQTKTFITPTSNVSTSIEVDLEIFSTTGTTAFLSFNQTFTDTNPAQICLDQNLTADGYLGNLQVRYGSTDKVTELYNIDKDPLNNGTVPNNVGLYPLNDTASTSFQIIYKGSEFLPVEGAILQIKRKYIGEGDFTIVEAPKTDAEGRTVAHFEVENVVYTIVVVKNGVILDSFNNIVLRCSNPLTEECELKLDSFRSSTDFSDWDTIGDITYTTAFDEDARTVVAQFNTVSGSARTVRLLGTKFDGVGNVTICDESLFSSAGTLTCSVDSSFGNFTMITELYSQGETVTTAVVSFEDNIIDVLGNDAFFFVFFIILIIPLLFITSTVGMVVTGMIGILFSMVILFVESTTIFSKGAALTWLIIAGLIIIWKITKRENI